MNENQENLNNLETTYCPNCGFKCNKDSRFCGNCGTQLAVNSNINDSIQPENQPEINNYGQQEVSNNKGKDSNVPLAIAAIVVSFIIPYSLLLVLILAIVSLFIPKYKKFGTTVLTGYVIIFGTMFAFYLLVFGLCFLALGSLG